MQKHTKIIHRAHTTENAKHIIKNAILVFSTDMKHGTGTYYTNTRCRKHTYEA
jgi:hypothetical protein